MYIAPKVAEAKPLPDYKVKVRFDNGEEGIFDAKPYLNAGPVFTKLKDISYFNGVKAIHGVVSWYDEVDFSPTMVFEETKRLSKI